MRVYGVGYASGLNVSFQSQASCWELSSQGKLSEQAVFPKHNSLHSFSFKEIQEHKQRNYQGMSSDSVSAANTIPEICCYCSRSWRCKWVQPLLPYPLWKGATLPQSRAWAKLLAHRWTHPVGLDGSTLSFQTKHVHSIQQLFSQLHNSCLVRY